MLKKGDKVSDFSGLLDSGKEFRLQDYKDQDLILYFFPSTFTPGCTKEACSFRDNYSLFKENDLILIGISVNNIDSQAKFKDKYNLPFQLLADTDKKITKMFGVKSILGWSKRKTFWIKNNYILQVWDNVDPSDHSEEIIEYIKGKR